MNQSQNEFSYSPSRLTSPILWAFLLSIVYWIYLFFTTQMEIKFDSIGYMALGKVLSGGNWVEFFRAGPTREPVYLLIVAASIKLAELTSFAQPMILKVLQLFILFLTQVLSFRILKSLNIHRNIAACAILYIGFSPALVNSALSIYSEIATYPVVLGIIFFLGLSWRNIQKESPVDILSPSLGLGILCVVITLTKGIFEVIVPALLIPFFVRGVVGWIKGNKKAVFHTFLSLSVVLFIFYSAIYGYKSLNQKYNGNFTLTDRGSWALYGNTARRVEPLTGKRFLSALAYIPGAGVCRKIFAKSECDFWSANESDTIALTKWQELQNQGLSNKTKDQTFLKLTKKEFLKNPPQYALFFTFEGIKMLFWESTKIDSVIYPPFISGLFDWELFKNGLRLLMFAMTSVALAYLLRFILMNRKSFFTLGDFPDGEESTILTTIFFISYFLLTYIFFHCFFFALTRYSFSIAPLFIILIAFWIDRTFKSIAR